MAKILFIYLVSLAAHALINYNRNLTFAFSFRWLVRLTMWKKVILLTFHPQRLIERPSSEAEKKEIVSVFLLQFL